MLDTISYGWGPEEIHRQHPHLSLAQIHAALSYYYDHRAELDTQIKRSAAEAEKLRAEAIASGKQPTRADLEERLRRREVSV